MTISTKTTSGSERIKDGSVTGRKICAGEIAAEHLSSSVTDMLGAAGTLAGLTSTVDELNNNDKSTKVTWFSDFLGDSLPPDGTASPGAGTGNAVSVDDGFGGIMFAKSSSADAAFTDNASAWALGYLQWKAAQGGLCMEARVAISDVSEAYLFFGFTDQLPDTGLEQPLFLTGANIDSDATDACGILYDVDGTTKQWCHGGVKAGTDTTPAYSGTAPTDNTYVTLRVEVSSDGAVQGFINGTAIGTAVANAVTTTAALAPVFVVANRSANVVIGYCDYFYVQGNRVN